MGWLHGGQLNDAVQKSICASGRSRGHRLFVFKALAVRHAHCQASAAHSTSDGFVPSGQEDLEMRVKIQGQFPN